MSALRKLAAAAVVLASVHAAEAMTYSHRLYKGHLVIDAVGTIEPGEGLRLLRFKVSLPAEMRQLFDSADGKNAIVLDSPGGNLNAAFTLANIISGYRLMTGVAGGGQCGSACVVAWAAGVRKSAAPDSHIGVHSASLDGTAGHSASGRLAKRESTGIMARWFQRTGAPDNVVTKTLDTPSDSLYWLTPADLAAWNVTTVE